LLDVPAFVYRLIAAAAIGTLVQRLRGNPAAAFKQENFLLFYFAFIKERWKSQLFGGRNKKLSAGSDPVNET
jgi:hypothetical protein